MARNSLESKNNQFLYGCYIRPYALLVKGVCPP